MTPGQAQSNPLRDGIVTRTVPQACTVVIFGATGDLTHRKLIPALYNLAADGELPPELAVVGMARRPKTDDEFRNELEVAAKKFSRQTVRDDLWKAFASSISYHQSEFHDADGYKSLGERLQEIERERQTGGNRLFYLAVAPDQFETILKNLAAAGLNKPEGGGWARVIVEKPFGTDLASARELNAIVRAAFPEEDTYRIDHFLGKETAQNILVLRFANAIFEPLWNTRYIDHVQITAAETLGVEGRAGYYEGAGALRDMVQNHLLQLLCLVGMEPPTDLKADSIRDEKVKIVRSLRRLTNETVMTDVVRAQYSDGAISGKPVPAYRAEQNVKKDSKTETFVALRLHIDNWRWADVPIYMRVGKRLPKSGTEISVHFKKAPAVLFNKESDALDHNVLVIRIQPDEGISLRMQAKVPGSSFRIEPVKMDFHYGTSFGKASPEAYERLLLDAMSGDATLFARRDEVEQAWAFIDVIEDAWREPEGPPLHEYPAGSWGPEAADELLARDGRAWRRLSMIAPAETFATGMLVEIGKIERELKKLWEQGGEMMARASLINLAVYSEAPDSLSKNTQIVAQITEDHACRAIVIAADPQAKEDHVEAWIAAHCHVSRAGSKQVCSEQISFALAGSLAKLLPNIVFSHLDSDLPFYLWWQGEFHDPMDPQLWSWVDRLIYDSQSWRDFDAQMRLVEMAQKDANQRVVLCDLNWTRLVHVRLAVAQFFDAPAAPDHLANLQRVEIVHGPGYRSTAILLAGWLAAQLGWTLVEAADETTLGFSDCAGEAIRVTLEETAGDPIVRCSLFCGAAEFRVVDPPDTDLLEVTVHAEGRERMRQLMPAGQNNPVALMREELMRGGPHRVYLRAIETVRGLL